MVAKTLDSAERFGKCLVVLAFAALPWAASNAASAQEWSQVSQETLDKYLFSPSPGGPATGAGTLRWESDMLGSGGRTRGTSHDRQTLTWRLRSTQRSLGAAFRGFRVSPTTMVNKLLAFDCHKYVRYFIAICCLSGRAGVVL